MGEAYLAVVLLFRLIYQKNVLNLETIELATSYCRLTFALDRVSA